MGTRTRRVPARGGPDLRRSSADLAAVSPLGGMRTHAGKAERWGTPGAERKPPSLLCRKVSQHSPVLGGLRSPIPKTPVSLTLIRSSSRGMGASEDPDCRAGPWTQWGLGGGTAESLGAGLWAGAEPRRGRGPGGRGSGVAAVAGLRESAEPGAGRCAACTLGWTPSSPAPCALSRTAPRALSLGLRPGPAASQVAGKVGASLSRARGVLRGLQPSPWWIPAGWAPGKEAAAREREEHRGALLTGGSTARRREPLEGLSGSRGRDRRRGGGRERVNSRRVPAGGASDATRTPLRDIVHRKICL